MAHHALWTGTRAPLSRGGAESTGSGERSRCCVAIPNASGARSLSRSVLSNAPAGLSNNRFSESNGSSVLNCPVNRRSCGSKRRFCTASVLRGRSIVLFLDSMTRREPSGGRFGGWSVLLWFSTALRECSTHEFRCSTVLFPCSSGSFRDTAIHRTGSVSRFRTAGVAFPYFASNCRVAARRAAMRFTSSSATTPARITAPMMANSRCVGMPRMLIAL